MRDLSHLLKTKNHTGNTGNTGNYGNAEPERVSFLQTEKGELQEMHEGEKSSLCGQKSFDEIPTQEPHREERRDPAGEMPTASEIVAPCSPNAVTSSNPADYQGPDSFETCFQKCLTDIAGRFDKLPWLVRFERTPGGIRSKDLAEILGASDHALEIEIQAEMNRLWSLGLTQDEGAAAGTYQEFRAVVIKWYRLWIVAIDRHKRGGA